MGPPFEAEAEASDGQAQGASTQTLTALVFQRLRTDILRGRFKPGARLRLENLRAIYGTGATPLREALTRLTSYGLVVAQDQRGFSVPNVSPSDLDDLVRTRIWTDGTALRASIAAGDDAWEAQVVAAHHRLSRFTKDAGQDPLLLDEELEARHRAFHQALVAGCGSRRMIEYSSLLYDQADRYRRLAYAYGRRDRNLPKEHEALYAAVMDRDAERAAEELAIHYERTRNAVLLGFAEGAVTA